MKTRYSEDEKGLFQRTKLKELHEDQYFNHLQESIKQSKKGRGRIISSAELDEMIKLEKKNAD